MLEQVPLLAAAFNRGREDFCLGSVTTLEGVPMNPMNTEAMFERMHYYMDHREDYGWLEETLDDDYYDLKKLFKMWQNEILDFDLIEHFISNGPTYMALVIRALEHQKSGIESECA